MQIAGLIFLLIFISQGTFAATEEVKINRICNCVYSSQVPYKKRRGTWGGTVGVQVAPYNPLNYQPDFRRTQTFDTVYGAGKNVMVEGVLGLKLNALIGSLTAQVTGGFFNAKNSTTNATLEATVVTGTLMLALDGIFKEPYVVPYGYGGVYTVFYREAESGLSVSGNSSYAPVAGGGLMFQLDWIDYDGNDYAYNEYGLENTFLYIEGRTFLKTSSGADFSTPIQLAGGLKVEF